MEECERFQMAETRAVTEFCILGGMMHISIDFNIS